MSLTIDAGNGQNFGITISGMTIEPAYLGRAVANLTDDQQAQLLLSFSESLQEFGVLEWRTQAGQIARRFSAEQRRVVDEVLGEIASVIHTLDDRDEDARG